LLRSGAHPFCLHRHEFFETFALGTVRVVSVKVLLALSMLVALTGAAPLTVTEMHADLAYLHEKILSQDSNPFLYISSADFERLYHEVDREVDRPLERIEFYRRAARLAASLKDGHTLVDPIIGDFRDYAVSGGVFPLEVAFLGDRLYITVNDSGDPHLKPGTEITGIDGKNVRAIVADYRGLINDVHPLYDVYARLFRELYWLDYGAPQRFAIEYRSQDGATGSVTVPAHVYPASAFHSYQPAGVPYSFRVLPSNVGLLTINSFQPTDGFDAFLERTFATLEAQQVDSLVIDVRKNGGGSGRLAEEVVSYLTDRPYKLIGAFYVKVTDDLKALYREGTTHTDEDTKRIVMNNPSGTLVNALKDSGPIVVTPPRRDHVFHGSVYLLTANNTFSAAAMFAAYIKCNALGTIVGASPGQSTNFVADAVPFTMPNSGLTFNVSFSEIHMPCDQSYVDGIQPDIAVTPSPESIAAGKDAVLDFTLHCIAIQRRPAKPRR
jgi:hypothetical protein